jgi:predicted ATPase/DNA-binding winged helix-turn-helix (wHTH) protein
MSGDRDDPVRFGPFELHARQRELLCAGEKVVLGGRAMDILIALAEGQGAILSKEDLIAAAWPTTFVHESNLKVTVAALRKELRRHCPSFDHIRTLVGRGYWLNIDNHENVAPATAVTPLPRRQAVIGRAAEIVAIVDMIATNRLVTIAGPGGMGKTTVALEVGEHIRAGGNRTICFVDLSRVAGEEFVATSIAAALGITAAGGDTLDAIASILACRSTLLVLDTCEHVLNGVAYAATCLLAKAPDIRILATSRQVLNAREEAVFWLEPLAAPPADDCGSYGAILRYPATQLLAARTTELTQRMFVSEEVAAIGGICRRLDGSPLALELVAGRLVDRPADEVLRELDAHFATLRRSSRDGPLRQRTLLLTLEWSYALLTGGEAAMLRALSIFSGVFDVAAATRIATSIALSSAQVVDAIAGLRAKSMLSVHSAAGEACYRLLDTTRAFAEGLLRSSGELDRVARAHGKLQLELLGRLEVERVARPSADWHAVYRDYADDLRKALEWSLHQSGDPRLGLDLVVAGLPLWHELSLIGETRRNCEAALERSDLLDQVGADLRLKITAGLLAVTTFLQDSEEADVSRFAEGLTLARSNADYEAECRILGATALYSVLCNRNGDPELSKIPDVLKQMGHAAARTGDRRLAREHETICAIWSFYDCDFDDVMARLTKLRNEIANDPEPSLPRFQTYQEVNVEVQMAALLWYRGTPDLAWSTIMAAERLALRIGHRVTLIQAYARGLIDIALQIGDRDVAIRRHAQLQYLIQENGMAAWSPIANCYGLAASRSLPHDKSDRLADAFRALRRAPIQMRDSSYFLTLGSTMVAAGEIGQARQVVDYLLECDPQRWSMPEMLRLRATTERAAGRDHDAEASLRQSVKLSSEIGLPSWTLRAACDLATLLLDHDEPQCAAEALVPIAASFARERPRGDVGRARTILKRLGISKLAAKAR